MVLVCCFRPFSEATRASTSQIGRSHVRHGWPAHGLTLIELLVVVGILMVLAAVLTPVISYAHHRAGLATEISDLRQIGIAAALYEQDTGRWPLAVPTLVSAGTVERKMAASPLDTSRRGQANELLEYLATRSGIYQGLASDYRRTYIGWGDTGRPEPALRQFAAERRAPGWLVSLTDSRPKLRGMMMQRFPEGRYRRLGMDGAVFARVHRDVVTQDGPTWEVVSMFGDAP